MLGNKVQVSKSCHHGDMSPAISALVLNVSKHLEMSPADKQQYITLIVLFIKHKNNVK